MSGDAYSRAAPGDRLLFRADVYNMLLDLLKTEQFRGMLGAAGVNLGPEGPVQIKVRNTTPADVERFGVLAVESPAVLPADNDAAFRERRIVNGITPFTGAKIVVTQEPIAAGAIGRAISLGLTPCSLNVKNTSDTYAAPTTSTSQLDSATVGPALIWWKESGTGAKNALVLLLGDSPPMWTPPDPGGGGGESGPYSGARISASGNSSDYDIVRWDTANYAARLPGDPSGNDFGPPYNCFRIPKTGYYHVGYQGYQGDGLTTFELIHYMTDFYGPEPGTEEIVGIAKDSGYAWHEVLTHWFFQAGDYVFVQGGGGGVTVKAYAKSPEFWIYYLGPGSRTREQLLPEMFAGGGGGVPPPGIKSGGKLGGMNVDDALSFMLDQTMAGPVTTRGEITTTNNTATTGLTVPITTGKTALLEITAVGRQTGGSTGTVGDSIVWKLLDGWRNVAGTLTRVGNPTPGAPTTLHAQNDDATSPASFSVVASGANVLIKVQGNTNRNYSWKVACAKREY